MAEQPIDDALLSKFLAGETSPAESARVRQWLVSRQPNPSGTSPPDWSQWLYRLVAVLVLVGGMGWLTYRFLFFGHDHPAAKLVTLTTNGQKISKQLPDGTRVLLNQHSSLRYPTGFTDDRREVTLTGEAFFDVAPDAARPFRVQAPPAVVQVLGTSFSVRAYDANVTVAVWSGHVRFSGGRRTTVLTQNQQATFEAATDTIRRSLRVSPNIFAYKTGQLVFTDEPLRNVVRAVNEVYDADVRLASAQLGNCRLTTRFEKTSLDTVLTVTAKTLGLQIRHAGKLVLLDGSGCLH